MKSGERRTKQRSRYELLERETDEAAEQRFRRPVMLYGKLTALASVRIIERHIEEIDNEGRAVLEDMARRCLERKDGGG